MLHGIILAAGASRRMGTHKALLPVQGVPLLRVHADRFVEVLPPEGRLLVGLGAQADALAAVLPERAEVVLNPDWDRTGPRETLQHVLQPLPKDDLVLLTPIDVPPAPLGVLRALAATQAPAVVAYSGAPGHPVLFRVDAAINALKTGTLRDAMHGASRLEADWPDALRNLNTPQDWAAWRRSQEGGI